MIRGNEKYVTVVVKLVERDKQKLAVKVSVLGMPPVWVPIAALDGKAAARIKSNKIGAEFPIRLWAWVAERSGLV